MGDGQVQRQTTNAAGADSHWSRTRESGTLFGLQILWGIHRALGRRVLSYTLYPVAAYFVLARPKARQASQEYLRTHYDYFPAQWRSKPGLLAVVRHFHEFSQSVVDKLLAWHNPLKVEDFTIRNAAAVQRTESDPRGLLIIGSHHGNIEYCRGFMHQNSSKVINVLAYDRHASNFVEMMKKFNGESRINIYQVDDFDIGKMLLFKEKIDRGEWVFVAADRMPLSGTGRTVTVDFLGRPAGIPMGPFLMAHALQCPVKLMFSWRNHNGDDNNLYFDVIEFSERIQLPRRERMSAIEQIAQTYAHELENVCREAPYQWFNFYDYWQTSDSDERDG